MTHKRTIQLIIISLTIVTALVFYQVRDHEFLSVDDYVYVTNNIHVKKGLTVDNVIWAFTTTYANFWHPLTWLSHMLDNELYGLNPSGHHITNLLLHIINTVLLFLVMLKMTSHIWQSAFVAALFTLHPLHVESVAWVAERKDVLSALFWFLTMWAYLLYAKNPGVGRYLLTLAFFVLGLMAKPMLVTLPFVLLLLDHWPLERLRAGISKKEIYSLVLEKIPMILLSGIFSVSVYLAQEGGKAVATLDVLPMKLRIANGLVSYMKYISKTLWPSDLSIFYIHPMSSLQWWQYIGAALALCLITAFVLKKIKTFPWLSTGWFWYLGTLLPVIGLVQVGSHAMADRYTYIPIIGLFIAFAFTVKPLWERMNVKVSNTLLWTTGIVIISLLSTVTWLQVKHWRNNFTLYERAIAVNNNNYLARNNLGHALSAAGRIGEAKIHYRKALDVKPDYIDALNNFAAAFIKENNFPEALAYIEEVLALEPDNISALTNLGTLLIREGRETEAANVFSKALAIKPDVAELHNNMGYLLTRLGRMDEGAGHFTEALRLRPDYSEAMSNLGFVLMKSGNPKEAVAYLGQALSINPNDSKAHYNMALAMLSLNRPDKAEKHFRESIIREPENGELHYQLGNLYLMQKRFEESMIQYQIAIQYGRESYDVHNNIGIVYASTGDFKNAITHFKKSLYMNPEFDEAKKNLKFAMEKVRN